MHTRKFEIKLDNFFILTQSRRCQVHKTKSFYQDNLEHLFVFVYSKFFLLYKAKEPSLKVHADTLAAISTINIYRNPAWSNGRSNTHNFVNFAPIFLVSVLVSTMKINFPIYFAEIELFSFSKPKVVYLRSFLSFLLFPKF